MGERTFTYCYGHDVPREEFACLVGIYNHSTAKPVHYNPVNAHHVYLWVEDPTTGRLYECAIHTRLSINSDMQVCFFREPCPVEEWPELGVSKKQPKLSYIDLGLAQKNFSPVGERSLPEQLRATASRSARIQVYGLGHLKGNGLHDVHQNSGEPRKVVTRESRINQDGALIFYFADRPGIPASRLWCCLKFEAQSLERILPLEGDEDSKGSSATPAP